MVRPGDVAQAEARSSEKPGLVRFVSSGLWPTAACLGLYFIVSIVLRVVQPNGLTLDEAEQSLFSQDWLLGYGPQPPFYNWVQNAVVSLTGISVLSLALPKFAMLFLCYLFFGMAARELDERPAFVSFAMLSLVLLPQVSYMPQQDLTHTVAVLMATALFLYGICRVLLRPDWQGYAIVGLAIGIGMISKYNFVLLPAAALFAVFCDSQWRARLFDRRLLLTIAVSIVIVLPHALWLADHVELATKGTIGKMGAAGAPQGFLRVGRALLSLVLALLAFSALALVVFGTAFRRNLGGVAKAETRWTRLFGRTMLFSLLGVVVVILATGTSKITERWLDPYLLALPLYLLLKLKAAGVEITVPLRRLVPLLLVLLVVTVLPSPLRTWTAGLTGSVDRITMPMAQLAKRIRAEGEPEVIVARGMHLAGNMRLQFPNAAVFDSEAEGGAAMSAANGVPVLVIEAFANGRLPAADVPLPTFEGRAPDRVQAVTLPYVYAPQKQMGFRYGWLR